MAFEGTSSHIPQQHFDSDTLTSAFSTGYVFNIQEKKMFLHGSTRLSGWWFGTFTRFCESEFPMQGSHAACVMQLVRRKNGRVEMSSYGLNKLRD